MYSARTPSSTSTNYCRCSPSFTVLPGTMEGLAHRNAVQDGLRLSLVLSVQPHRSDLRAVSAVFREPYRAVPEFLRAAPQLALSGGRSALQNARLQIVTRHASTRSRRVHLKTADHRLPESGLRTARYRG